MKFIIISAMIWSFISESFGITVENDLFDKLFNGYELRVDPAEDCIINDTDYTTFDLINSTLPDKCLNYHLVPNARYNKHSRPVLKYSTPINLKMGITINQIMELNEREQTIFFTGYYQFVWVNEFLRWRPSMHNGMKKILVPPELLWLPDIFLHKSVESGIDTKYHTNVEVFSDGTSSWYPPVIIQASCIVDMLHFPYDVQTCTLKFGSWTFNGEELDLQILGPTNNIIGEGQTGEFRLENNFVRNSEWQILSKECRLNVVKYECCDGTFPDVTYTLKLKRFTYYPTLTLVLPCVITSVLVLLTFAVPPEAGEKIGLNITVFLSVVVFMDQLNSQTPPMTHNLPVIGQFFVVALLILTMSLVSTIACLRLYHTDGQIAMSRTYELIFLVILPKLLFGPKPPNSNDVLPRSSDLDKIENLNDEPKSAGWSIKKRKIGDEKPLLLTAILNEIRLITDEKKDNDQISANEEKWKFAAHMLDKLSAVVYSLALLFGFCFTIGSTPGLV